MSSVGRVAPYPRTAAAPPITRIEAGSVRAASTALTKRSISVGGCFTEGLSEHRLEAIHRHVHEVVPLPTRGRGVELGKLLPDEGALRTVEEEGVTSNSAIRQLVGELREASIARQLGSQVQEESQSSALARLASAVHEIREAKQISIPPEEHGEGPRDGSVGV